jgi:hypothetical protein
VSLRIAYKLQELEGVRGELSIPRDMAERSILVASYFMWSGALDC